MSEAPTAFFRRDGEAFVPTGLGISPWDNSSQNGVSLAGLIALVLETVPSRVPMLTARVTLDIMGAVPMANLTPSVRILRDGPRIQLVGAELQAGGRTWVRATALRAREVESPAHTAALPHPFPADLTRARRNGWFEMFRIGHKKGDRTPRPMWANITTEVVEGEPLTPFQRLAIIADFGSGMAPLVEHDTWTFANLDIAMHMTRMPRGEWLLVDAVSESSGNGIGVATARIGDAEGLFATTIQTAFLNPR